MRFTLMNFTKSNPDGIFKREGGQIIRVSPASTFFSAIGKFARTND